MPVWKQEPGRTVSTKTNGEDRKNVIMAVIVSLQRCMSLEQVFVFVFVVLNMSMILVPLTMEVWPLSL